MSYDIRWLQRALKKLDLYHGAIDGISGPMTQKAIVDFKISAGLKARPYVGPITLRKLSEATSVPTEQNNGPIELPWINEINKVLGMHEVRDNGALSEWLRSDGKTLGDPSKLPWCGDAVETAVKRALPKEPFPTKLKENPYWARNWAQFGVPCERVYGAVASFVRSSGGHVAFLVGLSRDARLLRVRGGNQSNTINDTWISEDRLLALRWPTSFTTSLQTPAPVMESNGEIVSTNEA